MVWSGYLSRRTGAGVMGLHSIVFNLYGFAVTLAVAGIGLAVTRLVSEYEAANDRPGSFAVVRRALLCVGASGGGTALLLLLFARPLGCLLGDGATAPLVRVLSLPVFSLSVSAVFSGYFAARRRALSSSSAFCMSAWLGLSFRPVCGACGCGASSGRSWR